MGEVVSFEGYRPAPRFDMVAWTQARIEEAPAPTGPWTLIDTISLVPLDPDPANPRARSFTTPHGSAPDLWYRVSFLDAFAGTSEPTGAVQNGPAEEVQFASSDDFAQRIGLTLTDIEAARVDGLLRISSGLIQGEARQKIALVEDDTLVLPGTTDEMIKLPERPVVSVASVSLQGLPLTEGTDWYRDGDAIVRKPVLAATVLAGLADESYTWPLGAAGFGWAGQTVQIVYTHGFAVIPEPVKAICMEAVVRVWVNPGSVVLEHVGDTSTRYTATRDEPSALLLTPSEQRVIRRMFGRSAKSITIGR